MVSPSSQTNSTTCVICLIFVQSIAARTLQSCERQQCESCCLSPGVSYAQCIPLTEARGGLLNHLAAACYVDIARGSGDEDRASEAASVYKALASAGVLISAGRVRNAPAPPQHLAVTLDGTVVGTMRTSEASAIVASLRAAKVSEPPRVPTTLEVAYIPPPTGGGGGAYPGLYLFTSPSRMMRPVKQLPGGAIEHISSLEQVFMSIKCPDGGAGEVMQSHSLTKRLVLGLCSLPSRVVRRGQTTTSRRATCISARWASRQWVCLCIRSAIVRTPNFTACRRHNVQLR